MNTFYMQRVEEKGRRDEKVMRYKWRRCYRGRAAPEKGKMEGDGN